MSKVQCPHCKRVHLAPESMSGKSVACKDCGEEFVAILLSRQNDHPIPPQSYSGFSAWSIEKRISVIAIGFVLILIFGVVSWFNLRDTWEHDNNRKILNMNATARAFMRDENLQKGIGKYKDMLAFVGSRKIKSSYLRQTLDDAKQAIETGKQKLEERRLEAIKQQRLKKLKRQKETLLAKISLLESKAKSLIDEKKIRLAAEVYNKAAILVEEKLADPDYVQAMKRIQNLFETEEILLKELAAIQLEEKKKELKQRQEQKKHEEKRYQATGRSYSTGWFPSEGNLHRATVSQWRNASYQNKLATASDWLAATRWKGHLNSPADFDRLKSKAKILVYGVDLAVAKITEEGDNLFVVTIAVALFNLSDECDP